MVTLRAPQIGIQYFKSCFYFHSSQ